MCDNEELRELREDVEFYRRRFEQARSIIRQCDEELCEVKRERDALQEKLDSCEVITYSSQEKERILLAELKREKYMTKYYRQKADQYLTALQTNCK